MAFKEDFQKLVAQIMQRRGHVDNEEMTKQSLIIPFIQVLGYDVFDPLEVRPEYAAGFAKNKEKVDYAIFKDGKVVMFIEAKPVIDALVNHDAQLSKYFNSTPEAKVAVITNGIRYKFFTDLRETNIMDSVPFLELDLENFTDADIEVLQRFKKEFFEVGNIITFAEELVYMSNFKKALKDLLKNPSDDFIRFLVKDFTDSRLTASVVERFRPIVKKAITTTLLEIISQGILKSDETTETIPDASQAAASSELATEVGDKEESRSRVITTGEELAAFDIIQKILTDAGKDVSDLSYKDTSVYFGIFKRNVNRWFVRFNLGATSKNIMTRFNIEQVKEMLPTYKVEAAPKGIATSRVIIDSLIELYELKDFIIKCYEEIENE